MSTYKLKISGFDYEVQQLPFGSETSSATVLVEILAPDGATVLGQTNAIPGEILGVAIADMSVQHFSRVTSYNTAGVVMGAPVTKGFIPNDHLEVLQPTVAVSLPAGLGFTLAAE